MAERKIFRKIPGSTRKEDGAWRIREKLEIMDLIKKAKIMEETKSYRLRWLGHVERLGGGHAVKRAV